MYILHTNFKTTLTLSVVPVLYAQSFKELHFFKLELKALCKFSDEVLSLGLSVKQLESLVSNH